MTIRVRIGLVFAIVSLVLAVPALYGASRLSRLRDIAVDQGERNAEASLALGRFQTALSELDRVQRSHLVSPDDRLRNAVIQALDAMDAQVTALTRSGYAGAAQLPRAKVDSLRVSTEGLQTLIDMDRLPEAAREFGATLRLVASTQASLEPVASEIDRRRIEALASAREVSSTAAHSTLIGLLAALALAVLIAGWSARSLVDPLNRLAVGMADVAEGAFVVPADLPMNRQDEIGDLSRSFYAMTRRLAEFDTMRAEFVAVASHELKSPVHVIGGYVELLSNELGTGLAQRHREFLSLIAEQTGTATRLINRLLDISRLEARSFNLCGEEVSIEYLFASVAQWLGPEAERKQVSLCWQVHPSAPHTIFADPDLLRTEVLGNLVGNALKFTDAGGEVTVSASRAAGAVWFEVADTGIGIAPRDLPFVFEKYYQAGGRKRRAGTGLGLAIVRQAVAAHGGTVTVRSTPGSGTVFTVVLPVHEVPLAKDPAVPHHHSSRLQRVS
jgi:signal transduction histidine kinase